MNKKEKNSAIAELEKLNSYNEITNFEVETIKDEFHYAPIKHYLDALFKGAKPETASADLLKAIVNDILDHDAFSEVRLKGGFIDLAIQENKVNPIMVELKPGFSMNTKKDGVEAVKLSYKNHKDQIQKYLRENEYIILTNLVSASLFSRDALIDYEPFEEIAFPELLKGFLEYDSLWDTVRRLEDNIEKIDLEKEFFDNLKKWYEQFQTIEFEQPNGLQKEELIVLLMNKVIFIKTLEDYGLIPYKYLQDEYYATRERWYVKGFEKVFTYFFRGIEEWIWDNYDTELFKVNVWDYVKKDKANIERFKRVFELTLGLDTWEHTFGKGMIHYNYRLIDEDVFGKAYETFIAENKKDSGIYYTPKPITQYMSQKLVKLLFEEKTNAIVEVIKQGDCTKALTLLDELREIKIADTCAGSSSFLIKVFREIYGYYDLLEQKTAWVDKMEAKDIFDAPANVQCAKDFREKAFLKDYRKLIASIVLHHICAIDIDERALETGKTNIWKEAVKLKPEVFGYHKLPPNINHILPNLELNFINADSIYDLPIEQQINEITEKFKPEITELHKIRKEYIDDPFNPDILDAVKKIKKGIRTHLNTLLPKLNKPTFIALEFFYLFFDKKGNPLPKAEQGFSAIISNPPWEGIKPIRKEFAKKGKGEMAVKDFDKWFNAKLKSDTKFKEDWDKYCLFYEEYNAYLNSRYTEQGVGDPNFYKLLTERDIEIVKEEGYVNLLIPSGIQTDAGGDKLRKLMLEKYTVKELSSFENRGYRAEDKGKERTIKFFPDVDGRFKFSALLIHKTQPPKKHIFDARFYLLHPDELNNSPMKYDVEMIKKFSPDNFSIMEFESEKDYQLCSKIRGAHKLLGEYGFCFRREFDMTNDSNLFITVAERDKQKDKMKYLPLYEGKMIHQFKTDFAEPNYFIKEEIGRKELLRKEISRIKKTSDDANEDKKLKEQFEKIKLNLDYETYRLGYRAVGSSTNERTIISAIIPQNVFIGNSIHHLVFYKHFLNGDAIKEENIGHKEQIFLMSTLNSLVLNYFIRNKISANLSMTFMYELPIPLANTQKKDQIAEKGFNLLYHNSESKLYEDLKKELDIKVPAKFDSIQTRAELEVLIAKELFGLSKKDWEYLTSTFVYGEESTTKKELDQIIKKSIELY